MRSRSGTETSVDDAEKDETRDQQAASTSSKTKVTQNQSQWRARIPKLETKKIILCFIILMFAKIIWESFFVEPERRWIQPDFSDKFLTWVQSNPGWGLGAILIVIAAAVVSMVPIGTPLTLGCGFIYRGVYGWKLGIFVSTLVSMAGSTLGAIICFLLGRYLMRDTVKRWVRNYPLFDAIDVGKELATVFNRPRHGHGIHIFLTLFFYIAYPLAASEHGLKIMAMLYLTPVLPLGLVSYMCGTTAMDLSAFALAKVASLPLYLIYTFIGASAHSFIKSGGGTGGDKDGNVGQSESNEANHLEDNQFLIVSGLMLSLVMMTLITRNIRKELMKVWIDRFLGAVGQQDSLDAHFFCQYPIRSLWLSVVTWCFCSDFRSAKERKGGGWNCTSFVGIEFHD